MFASAFGWGLNPIFAAGAMCLSSFCVVTNALRLNLINLHKSKAEISKEILAKVVKKQSYKVIC